mmetsp:Transcript_59430/g.141613  ORF Transcript_59430/g.141613 Transcript_59430/m.141613 type:complete len:395 (-) Transcript_59430:9-1193(-)
MTIAELSTRIGKVDSGLDQRSALVNILKERLRLPSASASQEEAPDTNAPQVVLNVDSKEEGGSKVDSVIAEVDRTYGERKKIIDALRVQISVSAAQPKSAAVAPPRAYVQATPSLQAPPPPTMTIPATGSQCGAGPEAKRRRTSGAVPLAGPPAPAVAMGSAVPPFQAPPASAVTSIPVAPGPSAADRAEQALLDARKSKMLQNLMVAETVSGQPAQVAKAASATMIVPMQPLPQGPPVAPTPQPGSAAPPPPAAISGTTPATGMPPTTAGMNLNFAPPPTGATAEEYEAYRKDCWRQYNQYVNAWQKYYSKSKANKEAAASGAQKKASAPRPQVQWTGGAPGTAGVASGQGWGSASAGPGANSSVAARASPGPEAQQDSRSMDEIIHSELLGL